MSVCIITLDTLHRNLMFPASHLLSTMANMIFYFKLLLYESLRCLMKSI